jgi:hypothetical protein
MGATTWYFPGVGTETAWQRTLLRFGSTVEIKTGSTVGRTVFLGECDGEGIVVGGSGEPVEVGVAYSGEERGDCAVAGDGRGVGEGGTARGEHPPSARNAISQRKPKGNFRIFFINMSPAVHGREPNPPSAV